MASFKGRVFVMKSIILSNPLECDGGGMIANFLLQILPSWLLSEANTRPMSSVRKNVFIIKVFSCYVGGADSEALTVI